MRFPIAVTLATLFLSADLARATTLSAAWSSAADVPVTAYGYTATGSAVSFTLNFAPVTGTPLVVVNNTSSAPITGRFSNLTNGQAVALSYGGVLYNFVANYYGGNGNDLVLVWANNRAFAWGQNTSGQLGDNSKTQRLTPVPVTATGVLAGKTLLALAAGESHSLALCSDGTVAAWGDNTYGQLGDNSTTTHSVPFAVSTAPGVSALSGKIVVAIAAGGSHSLALCSDGTVAAWGRNNNYGQLGDNSTTTRLAPVAVNTNPPSALYGQTVVAIAAGFYYSLALCVDGTVVAWGSDYNGELGDNHGGYGVKRLSPVAVNADAGLSVLSGKEVLAIAAGQFHGLALCSDGTLAAWGLDTYGQLGDNLISSPGSLVPVAVIVPHTGLGGKVVTDLVAGGNMSLAACADGAEAAWGANSKGQLGDNTGSNQPVPVAVNTDLGVSALANKLVVATGAGSLHSLAVCSDGTMAAWGDNSHGQLGDGSTTQRNAPVSVNSSPLAAGERFAGVASSSAALHTLALVAEPPAPPIRLTGPKGLANGSFQFAFTNLPGAPSSVLTTTNVALPLSAWTSVTGLTEVSPGSFQFTDVQATNYPRRLYRVRSP